MVRYDVLVGMYFFMWIFFWKAGAMGLGGWRRVRGIPLAPFPDQVRGCFSSKTVVTMAFRLGQCAEKRWIRLHHPEHLAKVIRGVNFVNRIEDTNEKRIAT